MKRKKIKKVALVTCTDRGKCLKFLKLLAKSDDCLTVSLNSINITKEKETFRGLLTDEGANYSFLSI
jgi:hypothetical protein